MLHYPPQKAGGGQRHDAVLLLHVSQEAQQEDGKDARGEAAFAGRASEHAAARLLRDMHRKPQRPAWAKTALRLRRSSGG
eukprot:1071098-Pyramimonas_sp.AAC.2